MQKKFFLKIWIVAILLICTHTQSLYSQTVDELFKTVNALEEEKRYQDAAVLVERGLERFPGNLRLMMEHAYIQDQRGNRETAIRELIDLRQQFPESDTVLDYLGNLFLYGGLQDSAMACYDRILKRATRPQDSFVALLNIGSVYVFKQDYQQAIRHYEQMRKRFGDSLGVMNNLAEAYSHEGGNDKAIDIMEQVVRQHPDFGKGYNNLGMLYTELGNYTKAEKNFQKALGLNAHEGVVLNNYGHLLYKMKQYNKALKSINEAIGQYPSNPYAYRNRALVYLALDLNKEACADLEASQKLGFKIYYGDEVERLLATHGCKQREEN